MNLAIPISPALAKRLVGTPFVAFLDIDGTLTPIAPRPDVTEVAPEMLHTIAELAELPGAHVAVVTGRSVRDARRLVPIEGVGVIGNHGFEVLGEDGTMLIAPGARRYREAMESAVTRLAELAAAHDGVFVEDKTWTMSVHYRLAARDAIADITGTVATIAAELGLVVTTGKEVIELRPPGDIHKGTAVVQRAEELQALGSGATVVYIGDDRTDEDAFHALRAASPTTVTLRVGRPESGEVSNAEFGVETPTQVLEFLVALLTIRRARPPIS